MGLEMRPVALPASHRATVDGLADLLIAGRSNAFASGCTVPRVQKRIVPSESQKPAKALQLGFRAVHQILVSQSREPIRNQALDRWPGRHYRVVESYRAFQTG